MIAVAFVAINLWVGLELWDSQQFAVLILGALPMANVLTVGILIGQQRPGIRPFLLGFEAFGAMALALYVAVASYFFNEVVNPYLVLFLDPIANIIGQDQMLKIPTLCAYAVILLGWPQLAFALIGGLLSRRFNGTITRR
jgi:hypothetical protein